MTDSTSGSRVARGRLERFRHDQIVVSLPYTEQLSARLTALGAPLLSEPERSGRLGLALLTFDATAALSGLEKREPATVQRVRSQEGERRGGASDLQVLLGALREVLTREHAGWCPTFGKNRLVDRVEDLHAIIDEGRVRPTSAPQAGVLPEHAIIDEGGSQAPRRVAASTADLLRPPRPGRGARVGVVDTAISPHPYLVGALVAEGADVLDPAQAAAASHATFVAGLVLREAPGAVVVLRRAGTDGSSRDSWVLARQIVELADEGVDVVNLSLGCFTDDGQPPLVLERALAAVGPSTVVVAAAGNYPAHASAAPPPCWPAALDDVLAVGALQGDARADFSPEAPWVDVMAQGVGVASTLVDAEGPGYGRWDGTSFAAALVSGAIAGRVVPGAVDAPAAVADLLSEAEANGRGRPVVPGNPVPGWPSDEQANFGEPPLADADARKASA